MSSTDPPPPPPPHGQNPRPPGGLPDGNYDIFIVPPHASGSGFLYLPSLQCERNSFLAGAGCAYLSVWVFFLIYPSLKGWAAAVMAGGGGVGLFALVLAVGVAAWAFGKTQGEGGGRPGGAGGATGAGAGAGAGQGYQRAGAAPGPQQNGHAAPPPKSSPAASGWEKAREETRKREEERKRTEELKKKRDEAQKMREESERTAKAKAEKDKWEQARAREKETREREARERIAREKADKSGASPGKPATPTPSGAGAAPKSRYEKPTAQSYTGTEDAYSFRPYDTAAPKRKPFTSSASSVSGLSESSWAPSATTARTTPPPSHRGPYNTKDPDKIQIKGVYLFSDAHPTKPASALIANTGAVTDGLVLHITTEGLFVDDDVRGVPQREWDVKAWTLKLVEDAAVKSAPGAVALHVLRATVRDLENKRYIVVLEETEAWKVALGIQRLRKGSQVRSLGTNGMKEGDARGVLAGLGWV